MSLVEQISQSLESLRGLAVDSPQTVGWSVDGGPAVEADLLAVESLGCALRELRVRADSLAAASAANRRECAERICARVSYLLEPLAVLETDAADRSVLARSQPPARDLSGATYYELRIDSAGLLRVQRVARDTASGERHPTDIHVTCQVLLRLVDDVVASLPPQ